VCILPLIASHTAAIRAKLGVWQVGAVQHWHRGKTSQFRDQKTINCNTECGVMVNPFPPSAFEMSETQFLLEFLMVAFEDPAILGQCHKLFEANRCGHRSEPLFRRIDFGLRPFHEQPFFGPRLGVPNIAIELAGFARRQSGFRPPGCNAKLFQSKACCDSGFKDKSPSSISLKGCDVRKVCPR
jgi:hypothetical protein